jgi:hypothetical protein
MVDVPLPEGHPLRARGRTHVRVAKESEADVRNGINSTMQLKAVEAERDRLAKDHALLEARTQALSADLPKYESDPKWQALVKQIREAPGFGDEMAEQIIASLKAREELTVVRAEGQATKDFDDARYMGTLEQDVLTRAPQVFSIWATAGELWRVPQMFQQYVGAVDTHNQVHKQNLRPTSEGFLEWMRPHYGKDPRVQAAVTKYRTEEQNRERERIRAEERAKLTKQQQQVAADAAQRRAGLPPTSRALPSTTTQPATEEAPTREPPQHGTHRKAARERAAEIGRRYARP